MLTLNRVFKRSQYILGFRERELNDSDREWLGYSFYYVRDPTDPTVPCLGVEVPAGTLLTLADGTWRETGTSQFPRRRAIGPTGVREWALNGVDQV